MSWYNTKYKNDNGGYELNTGTLEYEQAKAIEKVCRAVIDGKVKSPEDVQIVVRCRECKHKGWVQEPCHGRSVDFCHVWDSCIDNPDDFCSYGERKEGAD